MPKSGVYLLTFPNGKVYVGCSASTNSQACIRQRLRSYRAISCKYQKKLFAALKKYDHNDIVVDILVISSDPIITFSAEMDFIKKYNSQNKDFGYNILPGGLMGYRRLLQITETKKRIAEKIHNRKIAKELEKARIASLSISYRGVSVERGTRLSDADIMRIIDEDMARREARSLRKKIKMDTQHGN
jgi:hypothetical protein